jgi:hypothetical protein
MSNRPDGTPGKKPPARSAKRREATAAMTLGNMRGLGPRSLDVTCKAGGHHTMVNADVWPDDVMIPSLGPKMRCTKCRHLGASVRPDWTQLRGVPRTPRR